MTIRTRIRKIIKLTALVITAVLLVCWIGSAWYSAFWMGEDQRWGFGCDPGILHGMTRSTGSPGIPGSFFFGKRDYPATFEWWQWDLGIPARVGGSNLRFYCIPIWAPVLVAGGVAFAAWKLDRTAALRARNNCCKKCGYHRAGLKPDALCPECGTAVKA